ncbi:1,3-beta-D-glucan synthase [Exophiala oligosperma]
MSLASSITSSIWPPVDPSKGEFRILVLDDYDDPDDPISGDFQIVSIHDDVVYDAISYAWADAGDLRTMFINGQRYSVASILTTNMRHCQIKTGTKAFWCDAISINQLDNDEKSQQIRIMQHIFAGARIVRVFLNPDSTSSPYVGRAVDVLLRTVHTGRPMDATYVEWLSGLRLDAWWTRVWVVQEFVLAKKLVFQFRDKFFDVEVLKLFGHKHFVLTFPALRGVKPGLPTEILQKGFDSLTLAVSTLLTHRHLHHQACLLALDSQFNWDHSISVLNDILFDIRLRHVTDPNDRIFGILALADRMCGSPRMCGSSLIEPDYTKDLGDIFMLFTLELIRKSKSLTLLLQCAHTTNSVSGLPSWVPDYSSRYNFEVERLRAHSIVYFDASCSLTASAELLQRSKALLLRGGHVDTTAHVGHCHDRQRDARHRWHLQALMQWEVLCRAVFADIEHTEYIRGNQTVCYGIDPERSYAVSIANFRADPDKIADHDKNATSPLLLTIAKRRLAITAKGYICLAPQSTKEGDAVYILAGGKVPFVLRPISPHDEHRQNESTLTSSQSLLLQAHQYRLVGDCFVEGIMYGEFIKEDHGRGRDDDFQDVILL